MIETSPSLYPDEMQQKLSDVREVKIVVATISRALWQDISLFWKNFTKTGTRHYHLGDRWQADFGGFKNARSFITVCHCLAQAHITWLFLEMFWFSQKYAKDCNSNKGVTCDHLFKILVSNTSPKEGDRVQPDTCPLPDWTLNCLLKHQHSPALSS